MDREARRAKILQGRAEGTTRDNRFSGGNDNKESSGSHNGGRMGTLVDIDGVIEQNDKEEEERRRIDADKIWKENEGLLSGEMV